MTLSQCRVVLEKSLVMGQCGASVVVIVPSCVSARPWVFIWAWPSCFLVSCNNATFSKLGLMLVTCLMVAACFGLVITIANLLFLSSPFKLQSVCACHMLDPGRHCINSEKNGTGILLEISCFVASKMTL